MTTAYNVAISETKLKTKRQVNDPAIEWGIVITRFLKDQLNKIIDHYQGSQPSFLTAGQANAVDIDTALKNWNYCSDLACHLYEVRIVK